MKSLWLEEENLVSRKILFSTTQHSHMWLMDNKSWVLITTDALPLELAQETPQYYNIRILPSHLLFTSPNKLIPI